MKITELTVKLEDGTTRTFKGEGGIFGGRSDRIDPPRKEEPTTLVTVTMAVPGVVKVQ